MAHVVATTAPESGGPTPAVREAIDTAAAAARAEGKSRGLHEDSSDMNDLIFKAAVRAALEQFMPKAQLELIRDASNAAVVRHEAETAAAVSEGKKEFTAARPLPTYTLGSVQRLVAFMVYTGIVRLPSLELSCTSPRARTGAPLRPSSRPRHGAGACRLSSRCAFCASSGGPSPPPPAPPPAQGAPTTRAPIAPRTQAPPTPSLSSPSSR